METMAVYKYANISAQKARLIANLVRNNTVERAQEMLKFNRKRAAHMVKKVLDSAVANAEHNKGADIDELVVSAIYIDEGPTQKRWRARAKGRSARILKRTCHITVKVSDMVDEREN